MKQPRRILVVRPDRVGDVIISSSCLPALRERFPDAEICFAARAGMQPVFEDHPLLNGFVALPSPALPFHTRFGALCATLKEPRYDCLVSLHPDAALYLAAWRIGVPHRIGYPLPWLSWTLTDPVQDRRREFAMHEAAYNFDLLRPLGIALPPTLRASLSFSPRAGEAVGRKLAALGIARPYLCLHLGAHSPIARWPASHFVDLARLLREQHGPGLAIVLIGHDAADRSHLDFRALAGDLPFHDLAGELDLAELGELLRASACLVTRDTGPSHLAAAVGCPVVVTFGRIEAPYGPTRWAPLADAERVRVVPTPAVRRSGEARDAFFQRAFHEITVEKVAAAAEEILLH